MKYFKYEVILCKNNINNYQPSPNQWNNTQCGTSLILKSIFLTIVSTFSDKFIMSFK